MQVFSKSILPFLSALLGITVFIPTFSAANVPKPAGIVTQVAGQATLHRTGLVEALPVKFRDRVFLQDKIHTQERTFVRVLLGGKALVTVRELSVLTITEDLNHATIDIQSGIVGLSVSRKRMKPGEYIEIRTPHAIAAVRGTTVLTQVTSLTNMAVLEGFIDIAGIATPAQTVQLTQLTALKATGQGLEQAGKMSPEAIAQANKQLQTDDNSAPGDSPLSDSVANSQSDQAAALAEALAPASDGKGANLQTEQSETNDPNTDSKAPMPQVLTTQDLDQTSELIVPPSQIISTGQSQSFDLASFSGGEMNGTDTLTVDGKTTVNSGTNIVKNPFNNVGGMDVNGGTISFQGGGSQSGDITTQAGTQLKFGGGEHNITGDVNGPGTVEVNAGTVNVNDGTYNVTGNSTTVSSGTMTFNAGATLTNLGALSLRGGVLNLLSAEAVSLPSFDFSGGTLDGTDTVTVTGATTVTGAGTKTVNTTFNNQGPLTLQNGIFQLLGDGSHTGSFDAQAGTTLEFGSGTQNIAGIDFSGLGTVNLTGGTFNTTGTTTLNNPFNNQGTVNVNGGLFNLNGGGTHTGDFSTAAGTTLEFGGGTHDLTGNVTGPGTVEISAGAVNVNGGTYNVTGNSTTVTGGTMTFNAGATLTNLGSVSISNGGLLRLLTGATHTKDFSVGASSTLEFGGGTHQVAAASLLGPGTVSVTGGMLTTPGDLFSLSEDLTTLNSLFQQKDGTTTIAGDALAVRTHALDASGTTDALFDISGGALTTTGFSSDFIESRTGGGTVTTGGSAVALSGTGSIALKGSNSSVLQSVGAETTISTGDTAVTLSGNAILDLDEKNSNDVALIQSGGRIEADGSILSVSDYAEARVGRSIGRLENGARLTTTNGGHVLESTGGTTTMGNSVLDLVGSTSQADISGYVVYATGGQINGPSGFNLVNVDAGELNTDGGIINAQGNDRIILDSGTTNAMVDITSADGTHDLGTTSGEAIFNLTGTSSTDTPLTKKDGLGDDTAVDQTLLRTSGATVTAKKLLVVDQALYDATATLFQFLAGSDVTVDPGVNNAAMELTTQANGTSTMPLLTLDSSNLTITTGSLLTVDSLSHVTVGTAVTSANLLDLNNSTISILNGLLADVSGTLTVHGLLASLSGTSSLTVTNTIAPTHTIGGFPVHIANGGTITTGNGSANVFVDTTDITVAAGGSLLRADGGTIHIEGEVGP